MRQLQTDTPRRVAVLRALYLGDFICATPALSAIRARFPEAEITLIGLPWMTEVLDRFGLVDRFEPFPGFPGLPETPYDAPRTERFLAWMRAQRFDVAIQMHGDGHISNGFIAAVEARVSVGYKRAGDDDQLLSCALDWREEEAEVHRWLRIAGLLGASASDRVQFPVTRHESAAAARLLGDLPARRPRIGLHCGSKLPSRRWPVDRFARLGNLLARDTRALLVLTGSELERPLTNQLQSQLVGSVRNLAGETDIGTLAAVIDGLDLLVTNDTGVSHIAAATGTPSVVLFGPSNPRRWAPVDSRRHRVIDGGGEQRCETSIETIPVDRVYPKCLEQLAWAQVHRKRAPLTVAAAELSGSR